MCWILPALVIHYETLWFIYWSTYNFMSYSCCRCMHKSGNFNTHDFWMPSIIHNCPICTCNCSICSRFFFTRVPDHDPQSEVTFSPISLLPFFLRHIFCFALLTQELNSFNYLDLYKLADLFNLTLLEKAVVDFLVKHLSELLKSHPEEVLALPYCLLREVLKSDRLTSLSEEQIWQVSKSVGVMCDTV